MQDAASRLPGISLLGTSVNKPRTVLEVSSFPGHNHVVYVAMSYAGKEG